MSHKNKMTEKQVLRWIALMETVNIIADECEKRNVNFNKIKLNPSAIQKHLDHVYDTLYIKHENKMKGDIIKKLYCSV